MTQRLSATFQDQNQKDSENLRKSPRLNKSASTSHGEEIVEILLASSSCLSSEISIISSSDNADNINSNGNDSYSKAMFTTKPKQFNTKGEEEESVSIPVYDDQEEDFLSAYMSSDDDEKLDEILETFSSDSEVVHLTTKCDQNKKSFTFDDTKKFYFNNLVNKI